MAFALKIATVLEIGVLVLLFSLSVWSIAIMIDRRRALARETAAGEVAKFRQLLAQSDPSVIRQWIEAHPGVHAATVSAAADTASDSNAQSATIDPAIAQNVAQNVAQNIDRAVRSYLTEERMRLEKGLPILATLGANAPFIGLFGTVLGIIRAFAALGESSGAASSVMSGISQALVATAAGLFVAIPAVVAFNSFSNRLRQLLSQCESLKDLYVSRLPALRAKGRG